MKSMTRISVHYRLLLIRSGWIVYEIQEEEEHYLVVFNAKGESHYYENAGNLEMRITNSRSNQENTLDNVSVAVMNVLS